MGDEKFKAFNNDRRAPGLLEFSELLNSFSETRHLRAIPPITLSVRGGVSAAAGGGLTQRFGPSILNYDRYDGARHASKPDKQHPAKNRQTEGVPAIREWFQAIRYQKLHYCVSHNAA